MSRLRPDGPAPPPPAPAMAEPRLAVRRRNRSSSERKRSRAPAQPVAASSPVARKRPSGGGEGAPAEAPVGDGGILGPPVGRGSSVREGGVCREGPYFVREGMRPFGFSFKKMSSLSSLSSLCARILLSVGCLLH